MPTPAKRPRKRILTPKVSKEAIKAKADAAAARSAGEEIETPKAPITPAIIPAEVLVSRTPEIKAKAIAKRRRRRVRYSKPLGKAICKMLGMGLTTIEIGRRPLMPHEDTILAWAVDLDHPFSRMYAHAREVGAYRMADEMLVLADDSLSDWEVKVTKDGDLRRTVAREHIDRVKLRIETRKWLLSKMLPKSFGDKVAMEHTGKDGGPIETAERPQPTGADHLADITKRYASKAAPATVSPAPTAKPAGKSASGLH